MDNITGIIVREHYEQKYIQKFPKIVPWVMLGIGAVLIASCYVMMLWYDITLAASIILLAVAFIATLGSMWTQPQRIPEEYLIEVTPRMSAIDWLVVEKDFNIREEGLLIYRCQRKGWKK